VPPYILYGINEDGKYRVAKFSTKELAQKYVNSVTLQEYPNGNRRFRRDSILGSYFYYFIDLETIVDVPIDPEPPTTPPQTEHVIEVTDRGGYQTRINYGRYVDEMMREKAGFEKLGYAVNCLTQEI
jgi:hypothetical protein